jgi:hypothetical protein
VKQGWHVPLVPLPQFPVLSNFAPLGDFIFQATQVISELVGTTSGKDIKYNGHFEVILCIRKKEQKHSDQDN